MSTAVPATFGIAVVVMCDGIPVLVRGRREEAVRRSMHAVVGA